MGGVEAGKKAFLVRKLPWTASSNLVKMTDTPAVGTLAGAQWGHADTAEGRHWSGLLTAGDLGRCSAVTSGEMWNLTSAMSVGYLPNFPKSQFKKKPKAFYYGWSKPYKSWII